MKKIAIYGAGGFGKEVAFLINDINQMKPQYDFVGYFDDEKTKGDTINLFPILGGIKELNSYDSELALVIAISDPTTKRRIVESVENDCVIFPSIVHPSALIGPNEVTSIGMGCIICAGTIITVNIEIKDFVLINYSCTVGHDTIIESYCSLMPTASISGDVRIGEDVYIGTGAKIINQLEIGKRTIVGAGAVVINSLPSNCTAVGVPAKVIK